MEKVVLKVSLSENGDSYNIHCDQGFAVQDVLHAMSCVIKAMVRDKLVSDVSEAMTIIRRMAEQESEVTEDASDS